jgi:hypothetical protein
MSKQPLMNIFLAIKLTNIYFNHERHERHETKTKAESGKAETG